MRIRRGDHAAALVLLLALLAPRAHAGARLTGNGGHIVGDGPRPKEPPPPHPKPTGMASSVSALAPVIVVGGGLAGLSAASEIVAAGAPVVILDKMDNPGRPGPLREQGIPFVGAAGCGVLWCMAMGNVAVRLGGNSAKASSGMNAAGSGPQQAAHIDDTPKELLADTLRSGKGISDPALVQAVAEHSADAVSFLQGFGVNLDEIQQLGGHKKPRTHRAAPDGKPMNIGFRIMSALIVHLEALSKENPEQVKIITGARVTSILQSTDSQGGERVVGVRYATQDGTEAEIHGAAVILATGGYSADREGLLRAHAPALRLLPTTNGPFATGDGVRLGQAVGAATVHLDQVQVHPTGLVDPKDPLNPVKILGPEILRGSGGILLSDKGQRFVNELDTRDKVTSAILEHCPPIKSLDGTVPETQAVPEEPELLPIVGAHLILTDEAVKKFGEAPAKFYLFKGLLRKFDSLAALCEARGLPLETVRATLSAYDTAAAAAAASPAAPTQDPFGKSVFPTQFTANLAAAAGQTEPPIYAALVTPVLHYCMGGLRFDTKGHILKEMHDKLVPVPGLLGAGEVTGGLHGANRLAGNSLLECVVFGRIAAQSALDLANAAQHAGPLKSEL